MKLMYMDKRRGFGVSSWALSGPGDFAWPLARFWRRGTEKVGPAIHRRPSVDSRTLKQKR